MLVLCVTCASTANDPVRFSRACNTPCETTRPTCPRCSLLLRRPALRAEGRNKAGARGFCSASPAELEAPAALPWAWSAIAFSVVAGLAVVAMILELLSEP